MKNQAVVIVALSLAAAIVGCKPANNSDQPTVGGTSDTTLQEVKRDTKEAAQATKDYAYAQKTEFVEKMKGEIADLNKEMDKLGEKIENSSAATKDEAKAKLQALREKTADLNKKLDSAKDATESTWEDVKSGFKKGYDEVKDSFNQARQWVGDKIAP